MNSTIENKRAVILLSGGLDSATTAAIAKDEGYTLSALSMQYGQRHAVELDAARKLAKHLDIKDHRIAKIDLTLFGESALTANIDVPKGRSEEDISGGIPITYVPARNTIFLSYALAFAEVVQAEAIFIGVNAVDYSGYPDCRPEFIQAFEKMANLATKSGVEGQKIKIKTPLMTISKADIIRTATQYDVDLSLTISCYDPDLEGRACGACDACLLRKRGFKDAGLPDVTRYQGT